MLARRLAASACALCLVVPAAASAMPGPEFSGHVHRSAAVAVVATGDTKNDLHVQTDDQAIAGDGSTDGWQIAALAEAGLIAVVALAAAGAMTSRTRREAQPGV